jgi:hypothetical protein
MDASSDNDATGTSPSSNKTPPNAGESSSSPTENSSPSDSDHLTQSKKRKPKASSWAVIMKKRMPEYIDSCLKSEDLTKRIQQFVSQFVKDNCFDFGFTPEDCICDDRRNGYPSRSGYPIHGIPSAMQQRFEEWFCLQMTNNFINYIRHPASVQPQAPPTTASTMNMNMGGGMNLNMMNMMMSMHRQPVGMGGPRPIAVAMPLPYPYAPYPQQQMQIMGQATAVSARPRLMSMVSTSTQQRQHSQEQEQQQAERCISDASLSTSTNNSGSSSTSTVTSSPTSTNQASSTTNTTKHIEFDGTTQVMFGRERKGSYISFVPVKETGKKRGRPPRAAKNIDAQNQNTTSVAQSQEGIMASVATFSNNGNDDVTSASAMCPNDDDDDDDEVEGLEVVVEKDSFPEEAAGVNEFVEVSSDHGIGADLELHYDTSMGEVDNSFQAVTVEEALEISSESEESDTTRPSKRLRKSSPKPSSEERGNEKEDESESGSTAQSATTISTENTIKELQSASVRSSRHSKRMQSLDDSEDERIEITSSEPARQSKRLKSAITQLTNSVSEISSAPALMVLDTEHVENVANAAEEDTGAILDASSSPAAFRVLPDLIESSCPVIPITEDETRSTSIITSIQVLRDNMNSSDLLVETAANETATSAAELPHATTADTPALAPAEGLASAAEPSSINPPMAAAPGPITSMPASPMKQPESSPQKSPARKQVNFSNFGKAIGTPGSVEEVVIASSEDRRKPRAGSELPSADPKARRGSISIKGTKVTTPKGVTLFRYNL